MSEQSWHEDIADAITQLGGEAPLEAIYEYVACVRQPLPRAWKGCVRGAIEHHSSDSEGYSGGADMFRSVDGIGNGIWGVR